jgi:hypothetical protein
LRLRIAVTVNGRSRQLANLNFEKTVYAGARDHNRGLFFQQLDQLLQDVKQGVGIRVNSKLRTGEVKPNGNGHAAGDDTSQGQSPGADGNKTGRPAWKKVPYFDEREMMENLKIHEPPSLTAK